MFPTWSDWDIKYTRKGLLKKSALTLLKSLALVAFIIGIIKERQHGLVPRSKAYLRGVARTLLVSGASILQVAANKV